MEVFSKLKEGADLLRSALGMGKSDAILSAISMLFTQNGGLNGVMSLFRKAGLGEIVDSWLGGTEKLPVQPAQVEHALGGPILEKMSETAGISVPSLTQGLATLLPGIVGKMVAQGETGETGGKLTELLKGGLEQFKKAG